jgi:hypothetical protein
LPGYPPPQQPSLSSEVCQLNQESHSQWDSYVTSH